MPSYMPTLALRKMNTGGVAVGTHAFKVALGTGTIPIANRDSANQYYGGSDFTEISGTNYTAGGVAITLAESLYTTGGLHHSAVAASTLITSFDNVTLSGLMYAYLYTNTPSGANKVAVCVFDLGGPLSIVGTTFEIRWSDTTPNYRVWYMETV